MSLLFHILQVAATSDLMLGYMDFFLGGDEKRSDLPPRLPQRFPMSIIFGGDGSYLAPFSLQSDNILTSLLSQVACLFIYYLYVLHLLLRYVGHLIDSIFLYIEVSFVLIFFSTSGLYS